MVTTADLTAMCVDLLLDKNVDGELLYATLHGSTLYGTNTSDSDIDIKGIYLPSLKSVITDSYPRTVSLLPVKGKDEKNKAGDIEITLYSLQEFLKMSMEGETISIDLLNSINTYCCMFVDSRVFKLFDSHELFYTKNMKAFLGYAKRQTAKYGMKGSRLAGLKEVRDACEPWLCTDIESSSYRLKDFYSLLPVNEFCFFVEKPEMTYYSILDALYQPNMTVKEFKELVQKKWDSYGERSRKAMENEGVDWKACSHALRAAYQLIEIYTTGEVKYPLEHREQLLRVKLGQIDFNTFGALLDFKIKKAEHLATLSSYPEKVDKWYWDGYLLECYGIE